MNVTKLDKLKEYISPDNKYTLTIYFYGGVFLKSDYSFVGHLTSNKDKEGRFILWLPPTYREISWVDNENLRVKNKIINVKKDTFDFRNY